MRRFAVRSLRTGAPHFRRRQLPVLAFPRRALADDHGAVRLVGVGSFLHRFLETAARRRMLRAMGILTCVLIILLAAMLYRKETATSWPAPFHFASLLMAVAMTSFSVVASVAAELGAGSAGKLDRESATRWIAIAIACWFVFLFLELVEWTRLVFMVELGPATPFGWHHLALTGTHWVAAAGGVAWLTWAAVDVEKHDLVAVAGWSHYLNIWWLLLVFVQYLANFAFDGL